MHMYNGYLGVNGMGAGFSFLFIVMLWTLFWKGLALWHSSRRGEYWWFLALLVINTVGILEIVYLLVFAKLRFDSLFTMGGAAAPEQKPAAPEQH